MSKHNKSNKKKSSDKSKKVKKTKKDGLSKIINEIRKIITKTKEDIYRIGELLVQAKKILEHGKFQKWVEENFEFKYQTANNFMNVYHHCVGRPDIVKTIPVSILYKITSKKFPEDLREHIFAKGDKFKLIKGDRFQKIYEKFQDKKLSLDSPEIKQLFKHNKKDAVSKAYQEKIGCRIGTLKDLKKSICSKIEKFQWPLHPETKEVDVEGNQRKEIDKIITEMVDAVNSLKPGQVKKTKLAA